MDILRSSFSGIPPFEGRIVSQNIEFKRPKSIWTMFPNPVFWRYVVSV